MLLPAPNGDYHFLPGIEPYSSGVIADPGFEIVHATLLRPVPYQAGFARIEALLRGIGRERSALCAVELRSPEAFTRTGFVEFNQGYRELLESWGLIVDGQNPVARTNVAPLSSRPDEPSLFGFAYTVPARAGSERTFVVAGAGELRGGALEEAPVVRAGETSPDAMCEKAAYVMSVMTKRLAGLGVGWEDVTATDIYTVQPIEALVCPVILDAIGAAATRGVRWYHARPPIDALEFEMDARGVRMEQYL